MPGINLDHILAPPSSRDIVWYYIEPCNDNRENDSDNHCCNYKTFHKSFAFVYKNNSRHRDPDGRKVYNCRHDSKWNPFSIVSYDNAATISVASFSSYAVVYNLDVTLQY